LSHKDSSTVVAIRNIRWQILIAIGGLILVAGLLLRQAPSQETVAPQPVQGGAYSEAIVGSLMRLNPIFDKYNQADSDIDRLIFSGLVRFDSRGMPIADLAERWAVSADATLYTFTLRNNALWHDGKPVTSDDVIYTFSKFKDTDYPGPADLHDFWRQIDIIKLDEHTIQFRLPEPFAPFLDFLTIGLLPDHLLRGVSIIDMVDHPFNLEPIGTGPYQFDRFLVKDGTIVGVSLTAFSDYYGQIPFLQRFEFHFFANQNDAADALFSGDVQGFGGIDQKQLEPFLQDPTINLYSARLPEIEIVFLNLNNPEKTFLAEKQMRQALLLAINRQHIINQVLSGQGTVADSPILPGTWAYSNDINPLPFDPEQAAIILDALEWELPVGAAPGTSEYIRSKEDEAIIFNLVYADDPIQERVANIIKENWAAIGVQVDLVAADGDLLMTDYLEPRAYEAALVNLDLAGYPDPDPYPFWHDALVETGQNYSGLADRNISIWLEQARTTPDFGRRAKLYRSFQYRFHDQSPALLLYNPVYSYAVNYLVQGITIGPIYNPSDRFNNVTDWYLVARRSNEAPSLQTPTP
jgi:peptide/nickel transport system substrate-binding protein